MELQNPFLNSYTLQRFGLSSSASPQSKENGTSQNGEDNKDVPNDTKECKDTENSVETDTSDQKEGGLFQGIRIRCSICLPGVLLIKLNLFRVKFW